MSRNLVAPFLGITLWLRYSRYFRLYTLELLHFNANVAKSKVGQSGKFQGPFVSCFLHSDDFLTTQSLSTFMQKHSWTYLYVATLRLVRLTFLFLSCRNAMLMLCLDLGTKSTWLGLGEHHSMA